MAHAAIAPTRPPKIAAATFWYVYDNANPAICTVWRDPAAKAWFVADPDRTTFGTTTPVRNKLMITSIISCSRAKAFCLSMTFPLRPHSSGMR